MSFKQDHHGAMFWCTLDLDSVEDTDITDARLPVGQIEPLEGLDLVPGDIVPVGRDDRGNPVYLVDPNHTHIAMSRAQCALLASLLASNMGATEVPTERDTPLNTFLAYLLDESVPRALHEDSAHGAMERHNQHMAILKGDLDQLPAHLQMPASDASQ
ncbi:hypothetical protein ACOI1H_16365 [Loktanella sp. DJP18]|uniref:hypothetical protein n=1 Tax=Loktanella sp. DJP18 TaxID=3409788 RepID=UPI003BB6D5E9